MTNDLLISLIASLQAIVLLLSTQVAKLPLQPAPTSQLAQITITSTEVPTQITTPLTFTAINNLYSDAVVNILCGGSGKFHGGTATGVIISPSGLVLVNAHIAQYMLLEQATNAPISCTVRIGNPAKAHYKATVLYMPPSWVIKNAKQVVSKHQTGTGEDDYAILQLTKVTDDSTTMPKEFTYLQTDASLNSNTSGQSVLIRAYPAEFIGSSIVLKALRPISTVATIGEIATFAKETVQDTTPTTDLISLGGTIVAQGGSSGGAVINDKGKLIGLIVTSTRKKETKDRNLKAITLSHINNSIKKQTNMSLDEIIAMPYKELSKKYRTQLLKSAQLFANAYNK